MKTNKHNLDNYFEAARRDDLPFSIDEARTTIEKAASTAGTTSFFSKLIQGKNKMISIPIAATSALIVGLLSFNMLTQTQEQEISHPAHIVQEQINMPMNEYTSPEIETAMQEQPLIADNKTPEKHERIIIKRTKNHDTNIIPNIDVSGIKLIELDDNKLAELGVTQSEDGDYTQFQMGKTYVFKVFNDLTFGTGHQKENYTGISPVMVTDMSGNRKITAYNTDLIAKNMQYRMLMHKVRNKSLNIEKLREDVQKIVNSSDNDEHFKRININRDSLAKHINIDSLISVESISSNVSNVNADDVFKQINIDSVLNSLDINVDRKKQVQVVILNTHANENESEFEVEIGNNITIFKKHPFNSEGFDIENLNIQEIKFDFPEINVNEITDMVLFKSREAYHQVNKLVPVSVPIKNAIDSEGNPIPDYTVIAWYEPTEELLEHLPADVAENLRKELNAFNSTDDLCDVDAVAGKESYFDVWRTCSGAIENLSVFPNPTDGNVNIKFDLKTERNYNVSLHNLMGSKIMDLGDYSTAVGEIDLNFNLKNVEAGLYLIVVQTESGEQAVQRIIKN